MCPQWTSARAAGPKMSCLPFRAYLRIGHARLGGTENGGCGSRIRRCGSRAGLTRPSPYARGMFGGSRAAATGDKGVVSLPHGTVVCIGPSSVRHNRLASHLLAGTLLSDVRAWSPGLRFPWPVRWKLAKDYRSGGSCIIRPCEPYSSNGHDRKALFSTKCRG